MPVITFVATSRRPDRFRQDPSWRYRCENLALALQAAGTDTRQVHLRNLAPRTVGEVAVFHRPLLTPQIAWLLWRLRRRGVYLVADFDDLVFDPELAAYSPAVLNGILPVSTVRRRFAASLKALDRFDRITVSTQPLQDHLLRLRPGRAVTWIPNAVHHDWITTPQPPQRGTQARVLGYFPGTRSHDRDFQQITVALETLLARHPQLQLHVTGILDSPLQAAPGQLVRQDRVDFSVYPQHVARAWVNLSPLENTPFNQCKSALKIIEAGYLGIPTVCSPNPDTERFGAAGAIEAMDSSAWIDRIEALLQPDIYQSASQALRERVLNLADPARMATRFLQMLEADGVR